MTRACAAAWLGTVGFPVVWLQVTWMVSSPVPARVRAAWKIQRPGAGKIQPVPHSSPGRCQVLPPCGSGPHAGRIVRPAGPLTAIDRSPAPVIRQTILISVPVWSRAGSAKNSAHNVASEALPCRSFGRDLPLGLADAAVECAVGGPGRVVLSGAGVVVQPAATAARAASNRPSEADRAGRTLSCCHRGVIGQGRKTRWGTVRLG